MNFAISTLSYFWIKAGNNESISIAQSKISKVNRKWKLRNAQTQGSYREHSIKVLYITLQL